MLKKGRRMEIPIFLCADVVILVYEAAMWVAGAHRKTAAAGGVFLCVSLWVASCIYWYVQRERHSCIKSSISINRLVEQGVVTALFVGLSGMAMYVLVLYDIPDIAAYCMTSVFLLLNMWYLFSEKPPFLEVRVHEESAPARRRGYAAGRMTIRGGQLLEDDGGAGTDEGVVEDARIIHALMVLFEKERLYMNVDIKIANVALMIGTNKTYLSRALNRRLSKNFCQFVNYYRVREVCILFIDNPHSEMKELAEQCGFNSSSNFSIVFKYNTGFTPGDWCRMVKMKLENNETVSADDYLL